MVFYCFIVRSDVVVDRFFFFLTLCHFVLGFCVRKSACTGPVNRFGFLLLYPANGAGGSRGWQDSMSFPCNYEIRGADGGPTGVPKHARNIYIYIFIYTLTPHVPLVTINMRTDIICTAGRPKR